MTARQHRAATARVHAIGADESLGMHRRLPFELGGVGLVATPAHSIKAIPSVQLGCRQALANHAKQIGSTDGDRAADRCVTERITRRRAKQDPLDGATELERIAPHPKRPERPEPVLKQQEPKSLVFINNGSLVDMGLDTSIMETLEKRHARHTPTDDRNPWMIRGAS